MSDPRQRAAEASALLHHVDEAALGQDGLPVNGRPDDGLALASVDESGIDASQDVPVHVAWSRVMGEVQYISKDRQRNDVGGRYNFRGIEDVLNAVGPALRKHGVVVVPIKVEPEWTVITTAGGKAMNLCRATVTFAVIGPKGDRLPVDTVAVGEAFDSGDKSSTKAQSVAQRVAYLAALNIPTQQPQLDPEHGEQHEIAVPKPYTAIEYRDEILDARTTRSRMLQMRRELVANPAMGAAVVTGEDGASETTLIGLCTHVGRQRFGGPS